LIGYLTSIEQKRKNRAELQAALAEFDQERAQYNGLQQSLADLGNCRNTQIFRVQQQIERKEILPKEGKMRLDLVEKWIAEDDSVIAKAAKMETDSITTFAQAHAVAEGESAENAKASGSAILERYAEGTAAHQSDVDVEYIEANVTSLSPVPIPANRRWVTSEKGANVRSQPTKNGQLLGTLAHGTELDVQSTTDPDWVQIPYQGQSGYVARGLTGDAAPTAQARRDPPRPVRKVPRPEAAAGRIVVRSPSARSGKPVTKALAQSRSLQVTNQARKTSNSLQLAAARKSLLDAALESART
jgi:uncharacterized protein YgiM (DUF1202 family)